MATEGIDRHQFGNRPISARHSREPFQITSDIDIALIDRIELRPHDDRIAPLSDEQIDGDRALSLICQTNLHMTLLRQASIPSNNRTVEERLATLDGGPR